MFNQLTPQQQSFLMRMLLQHQGGGQTTTPSPFLPGSVPGAQGYLQASNIDSIMPYVGQPLSQIPAQGMGNPLMTGGNSAVSPQQQAAMQQYMQMLQSPLGWGAAANGQPPVWQMLMGRSPWYGQGTAVP